ncbi:MAG: glycosyltransferase family 2 protein [Acidobacteriota bacterium]|nr:glycosyltransferase family 2 protein [Acidobacteriota bacterium]
MSGRGLTRAAPAIEEAPTPVTVVIPVYDEAEHIERVVGDVARALSRSGRPHAVLILNDGSGDWSPELERRLESNGAVRVRSFYPNEGKGAVLNRAFRLVDTELAVVIDADGEYDAGDIEAVVRPLQKDEADWVMGSRYGFGRRRPRQYRLTYFANWVINKWFFLLSGLKFQDLLTGLYGFRTEFVADLKLHEKRFSYTAELVWKLLRHRDIRWREVPISYHFRTYAEGKKIKWWETGTILLALWRYKLSPRQGRR